jgi:hypothetical protein
MSGQALGARPRSRLSAATTAAATTAARPTVSTSPPRPDPPSPEDEPAVDADAVGDAALEPADELEPLDELELVDELLADELVLDDELALVGEADAAEPRTVNDSRPEIGWPSADTTRHTTSYGPGVSGAAKRWTSRAPESRTSPPTRPSGPRTTTRNPVSTSDSE